jgi:methyl-accepting chemotaxis protein
MCRMQPVLFKLYGRKDVEGVNRYEANINGVFYIKEIIKKGKQSGGGYTDYWFPRKGKETPLQKRGYSLAFEPFG